jgi:cytochrome oxidase assembly protein ShyY1
VLRTLLTPRYVALTALMAIVALACCGFGSWQIARLAQKSDWNTELRANAHAAPVPLNGFVPLLSSGAHPSTHHIQFHAVTATGTFDAAHVQLVREATVDNNSGFYVLTPFDTADGTLLVVRGFIAIPVSSATVPAAPPPPSGQLTIQARIQPAETKNDGAARLTASQVESINPVEQGGRLGRDMFDAYGELLPGQPGVGSLTPIPFPDLSNPAGGAIEPQHLAYIIQWYLFALLALAAPIAMARAETRHQHGVAGSGNKTDALDEFDGSDSGERASAAEEERRRGKLADRYGRAAR